MIDLVNVSKSFDDRKILNNISLSLNRGSVFGLIGRNGSGKTTIMNIILNRLNFEGEIRIDGIPNHIYIDKQRESIGFVPDTAFLYDYLTGIEFIKFYLDMHKIQYKKAQKQVEVLFKLFELTEYKDHLIKDYSFGMKRKINLISVFLQKPKYLLLDEPVIGMDAKSIIAVKKLIRSHAAGGTTVLFSTHMLDIIEYLCDGVAILHNKEVKIINNISDIKQSGLENIYLEIIGNEIDESIEEYNSSL